AEGRRPAARGAAEGRLHESQPLRSRHIGVRRPQRVLPPHGQARGLQPPERREREAAEPQQPARLPRWRGDRGRRSCRRHPRLPLRAHERRGPHTTLMPPSEHFAAPPNWEWWILGYFVLGGISGGSYAIATIIRIFGAPADQRISRLGYIVSFIALIPCPIFLTLDLGQPLRFWHMLVDTSEGALAFKYWSPMSLGAWALVIYGRFSCGSFLGALAEVGTRALSPFAGFVRGTLGSIWGAIGTFFGLFIASYTGVLLAVSNQAVWSDAGWVLGGLFLASGLTGSAALLLALLRWREVEAGTAVRLEMADRNFAILEAILVVLFVVSVGIAGTIGKVLGIWIVLWILVILGLLAPFAVSRSDAARRWPPVAAPVLSLLGLLALRALIIFGPQS